MDISHKYSESFEEIIPKDSVWVERTYDRKPSMKDFIQGRVAISEYFLNEVLRNLRDKHFCVVLGNKDTGKTWLCYAIGYELQKRARVRFINIDNNFNAKEAWNEIKFKNRLPELYLIIEDCHINKEQSQIFLEIIIDEVKKIKENQKKKDFGFLFTMRKVGKYILENEALDAFYNLGDHEKCVVNLSPVRREKNIRRIEERINEHIKEIIKKFIELKKTGYGVSEEELEFITKKWGNDLYWAWLRLDCWQRYKKDVRLADITDECVYDSIWSGEEINLSYTKHKEILLRISALCQFEPLVISENFLRETYIDEKTLESLRGKGIISFYNWRGYDFLSVEENFANAILSCARHKDPSFKETEENYVITIFNDYLKSKPPNWVIIFRALYLARVNYLANKILISFSQDNVVWQIVKESIKHCSLVEMEYLLQILLYLDQKQNAQDAWLYYYQFKGLDNILQELVNWEISGINAVLEIISRVNKKHAKEIIVGLTDFFSAFKEKLMRASDLRHTHFYKLLYEIGRIECLCCGHIFWMDTEICYCAKCNEVIVYKNYNIEKQIKNLLISFIKDKELTENLQKKLKLSTATNIRRALKPLSKGIYLNEFFVPFSNSDWRLIIDSSTLNSIRLLFYDFLIRKLNSVAINLAKALLDADLDDLIAQHNSFLYNLGRLIGNVRQVDPSLSYKLVEKLSQIDLNPIFSRDDRDAQERGFSKAEIINLFLSKIISFTPEYRKNIIENITDKTWFDALQSTDLKNGIYLIWNIYIDFPSKAQGLVRDNAAQQLFQKWNQDQNPNLYLPLLGLLTLCNFRIYEYSLIEKDISKIKQLLKRFEGLESKEKPAPTLFILALVSLRIKLSAEQYENNFKGFIINKEPIHTYIYSHKNLIDLIKAYSL